VSTTGTVWMGLTLGCARCHDHKFDPVSQKEFYEIFAYFNNVPERGKAFKYGNSPPMITAPTDDQRRIAAPAAILAAGASHVVIARPIITHPDPTQAVRLTEQEVATTS